MNKANAKEIYDKFIIINKKHLESVSDKNRKELADILWYIGLENPKIKNNKYIAVNQDEPYAQQVIDLILGNTRPEAEETKPSPTKSVEEVPQQERPQERSNITEALEMIEDYTGVLCKRQILIGDISIQNVKWMLEEIKQKLQGRLSPTDQKEGEQ